MTDRQTLVAAFAKAGLSDDVDVLLGNATLLRDTLLSERFAQAFWGTELACPFCGRVERHQSAAIDLPRWVGGTQRLLRSPERFIDVLAREL